ncbi:hypothetical protein [Paenibacillus shenyangensis]|uniref:hypothetical protein n=1 Tax=Paenibacillus sp. A9 TaxID=1284352 RepID=UPI00035C3960|nr:hypothetical protein [Paenibacillus sp. A9]
MYYQINPPDLKVNEWSKIDLSNLNDLLERYSVDEAMTRTSIKSLQSNQNLMVINVGTLNIKIDSLAEISSTLEILKSFLENQNKLKNERDTI